MTKKMERTSTMEVINPDADKPRYQMHREGYGSIECSPVAYARRMRVWKLVPGKQGKWKRGELLREEWGGTSAGSVRRWFEEGAFDKEFGKATPMVTKTIVVTYEVTATSARIQAELDELLTRFWNAKSVEVIG
jgi:hypothetical protein